MGTYLSLVQMLTALKRWVQSTIGVSSKEANAFLILLPVLFLIIFSQPLYRWMAVSNQPLSVQEIFLLDSLIAKNESAQAIRTDSILLFSFDPNTATIDQLISLGISKTVANRIELYRTKGGKFNIKSDLGKMYGLDSSVYRNLVPYIALPDKLIVESKGDFLKTPKRIIEYDLNKADTADFKSVKGIGPVLAGRIIKYRQSLGGFVHASQLKEVFGLDTLVLQELAVFHIAQGFIPEKLKINQATEEELDKHPYVSLKQAKAIVTYRMQHVRLASVDDLGQVKLLNDELIRKITPYISFE
jgi:competence protein ComEA